MDVNSRDTSEDVIDLAELLLGLRARVWLIALFIAAGAALAYLVPRTTYFEVRAAFEISDLNGKFRNPDSDPVIDRLVGTRFVASLYEELEKTGSVEALLVGPWADDDETETALYRFLEMYGDAVSISRMPTGTVEVLVSNTDAPAAARLANMIMELGIAALIQERREAVTVWLEESSRRIAQADARRDEASLALRNAVADGASEDVVRELQGEVSAARANHDLLKEAFKDEAVEAISLPEMTVIEEARVPRMQEAKGISPVVVFGAVGGVVGSLIAGLWAVMSGRIHSPSTMQKLVAAEITAAGVGAATTSAAFSVVEPGGTELLVSLRSRGSGVTAVAATDESITPMPVALWAARRLSRDGVPVFVTPVGRAAPDVVDDGDVKNRMAMRKSKVWKCVAAPRAFTSVSVLPISWRHSPRKGHPAVSALPVGLPGRRRCFVW